MKRNESIRAVGGTRESDRPAGSPGSPGQVAAPPWLEASSASEASVAGSYFLTASVAPPKEEGKGWRP
jgi:hypothetical protein